MATHSVLRESRGIQVLSFGRASDTSGRASGTSQSGECRCENTAKKRAA